MKVITLHQPWATLIAVGAKTIETRSWSTKYRGPLAIHAALRPLRKKLVLGEYEAWPADAKHRPHPNHPDGRPPRLYKNTGNLLVDGRWTPLPFGSIVATCRVVDVVPVVDSHYRALDADERYVIDNTEEADEPHLYFRKRWGQYDWVEDQRAFGDFRTGRYAWILTDIQKLSDPVPFQGGQGLTKTWEGVL